MSEEARPARPDELGRCRALLDQAVAGGTGVPARLSHDDLHDPDRLCAVGLYDGQMVGMALARLEATEDTAIGVLDLCYVEPEARGVGVGAALIKAVTGWVEARGGTATEARALPGDRDTKRLLEATGFKTRVLVLRRPSASPGARSRRAL